MKAKLKYFFGRLILALVALHTIDVSIDLDHVTSLGSYCNTALSYDDIDSYSELIVEYIFHDDNLVKEDSRDDHSPTDKQIFKHHVLYVYNREDIKLPPAFRPVTAPPAYIIRNAGFRPEDYSHSDYTPPDSLAC